MRCKGWIFADSATSNGFSKCKHPDLHDTTLLIDSLLIVTCNMTDQVISAPSMAQL